MLVKRVTQDDVGATYCCAAEFQPSYGWTECLLEAREWFRANLGKSIEGYHLLDGERVVGMVYWARSKEAILPYEVEPGVACVYCTELLEGYKRKGHGKFMLDYMKQDLKKRGFKGILVPATELDVYMPYKDFLKQGFKIVKEHPPFKDMYYPLTKEDIAVKVHELKYKPAKDKVEVTLFNNLMCPVGVHMHHMLRRVAKGFGDKVKVVELEATPKMARRYGTVDPLVNGKMKFFGPVSEKMAKTAIQEEIDGLSKR